MTTTLELMKNAVQFGYERQTTAGVDPALGRKRWVGPVLRIPGVTEDYGHKDYFPLGSGRTVHFTQKTKEDFEFELEHLLSEDYSVSGDDDVFGFFFGSIDGPSDGDTGAITVEDCPELFVSEFGWNDPLLQITRVTVTGGEGTYTVNINGTDFTHVTTGAETATTIRDALIVLINGGAENVTGSTFSTDAIDITATTAPGNSVNNPGVPFVVTVTYTSSGGGGGAIVYAHQQGGRTWIHKFLDCRIESISYSGRADDLLMVRTKILGRIHIPAEKETECTGDNLSDLVLHTERPVHYADITFTLRDKPGGSTIEKLIKEFDMTFENNMERIRGDIQAYYPADIVPNKLMITIDFRTAKKNNTLLDIARSDPGTDSGRLDWQMVIDQGTSGFYQDFRVDTTLEDPSADLDNTQSHVDEGFNAGGEGDPVITMKRP